MYASPGRAMHLTFEGSTGSSLRGIDGDQTSSERIAINGMTLQYLEEKIMQVFTHRGELIHISNNITCADIFSFLPIYFVAEINHKVVNIEVENKLARYACSIEGNQV